MIEESGVGCFMNLHCGHNNAFTREEKMQLETILEQATTAGSRQQQQEQHHSIV
jgi:GAF domain-containing protein